MLQADNQVDKWGVLAISLHLHLDTLSKPKVLQSPVNSTQESLVRQTHVYRRREDELQQGI